MSCMQIVRYARRKPLWTGVGDSLYVAIAVLRHFREHRAAGVRLVFKSSRGQAQRFVSIRRAVSALAVAVALIAFSSWSGSGALRPAATAARSAPGHVRVVGFSTAGVSSAASTGSLVTVRPTVTRLRGGGVETTYQLPDGQTMTTTTPSAGFNPLTASAAQLRQYGFPSRPANPSALRGWTTAMAAYRSDVPPVGPLRVATSVRPSESYATYYTNWAGYSAGNINGTANTYVAVKADLTIPSTTSCSNSNGLGFWIGLGGTNGADNLVQQGVECGNTALGSGSAYRAFTEFANTAAPVVFCGYASWTFAVGHVIYQNMSFEASPKKAFFYIEDESTGVAHSCSSSPPGGGWSFRGNTADWVGEAPSEVAANFGSIGFTNTYAEVGSTSSWVTMGSQSTTEWISGLDSSVYCISPQGIGSGKTTFTDKWHESDCL